MNITLTHTDGVRVRLAGSDLHLVVTTAWAGHAGFPVAPLSWVSPWFTPLTYGISQRPALLNHSTSITTHGAGRAQPTCAVMIPPQEETLTAITMGIQSGSAACQFRNARGTAGTQPTGWKTLRVRERHAWDIYKVIFIKNMDVNICKTTFTFRHLFKVQMKVCFKNTHHLDTADTWCLPGHSWLPSQCPQHTCCNIRLILWTAHCYRPCQKPPAKHTSTCQIQINDNNYMEFGAYFCSQWHTRTQNDVWEFLNPLRAVTRTYTDLQPDNYVQRIRRINTKL